MITMKVKISNTPLIWLGIHLFPIYIYQRIPMIYFQKVFLFSIIESSDKIVPLFAIQSGVEQKRNAVEESESNACI